MLTGDFNVHFSTFSHFRKFSLTLVSVANVSQSQSRIAVYGHESVMLELLLSLTIHKVVWHDWITMGNGNTHLTSVM